MSKTDTHEMWCFKKIYKRCPFGTVKGIMEFIYEIKMKNIFIRQ